MIYVAHNCGRCLAWWSLWGIVLLFYVPVYIICVRVCVYVCVCVARWSLWGRVLLFYVPVCSGWVYVCVCPVKHEEENNIYIYTYIYM